VVDRTQCDKTGSRLRQSGWGLATKRVLQGEMRQKGVLLKDVATKRVPIDFAVRRTCVFGRKALFSAVRASCGIARRTVLAGALRQKGCNKGCDTNRLRVAIYPMSLTLDQRTNIDGVPKAAELIEISGGHALEASDRAIMNMLYQHAHDSGRLADPTASWELPITALRPSKHKAPTASGTAYRGSIGSGEGRIPGWEDWPRSDSADAPVRILRHSGR
jgi:hypothetical protein